MASIFTPTLLATFQTSHASSSKNRHVALSPVHGSGGELAVVAVQGDGVWTYDMKTLRPTTSYTVPPSTIFTSHPLSFLPPPVASTEKGKGKAIPQTEDAEMSSSVDSEDAVPSGPRRTTMIGVKGVEQGKGKQSGEIWCWRGEDDEKSIIQVEHDLIDLHHLDSSKFPILAVATNGNLFLLDSGDKPLPLPHRGTSGTVISSKIISTSGDSCGLVTVGSNGKILSFRIDFPEDGSSSARLTSETSIGDGTSEIQTADIAEDGIVSCVDSNNHLFTTTILDPKMDKATFVPYRDTVSALTSIPSPKSLILHALSGTSTDILLSLPASDIPIVVASSDISSFTTDGQISQISLLGSTSPSTYTVAFVVWHKHADKDTGRSVAYVCELSLPEKGFGMNLLLGAQARTATYLSTSGSGDKTQTDGSKPKGGDESRLLKMLEGEPSVADWSTIRQIMSRDKTLPSKTMVSILKKAMNPENLDKVYSDFLGLAPPAIDFRFELRKSVSVGEATQLLSLLVKWAEEWCNNRTEGLRWPDSNTSTKTAPTSLPSLDSVIAHSSLLLDSHLPLLVEFEEAAPLLESLSNSLGPLLTLQAEIRQLRAPVDALLTLAKREEYRRAEVKRKHEQKRAVQAQVADPGRNGGGGKKKKPFSSQKVGANDEAKQGQDFGKWKVEDFVF